MELNQKHPTVAEISIDKIPPIKMPDKPRKLLPSRDSGTVKNSIWQMEMSKGGNGLPSALNPLPVFAPMPIKPIPSGAIIM